MSLGWSEARMVPRTLLRELVDVPAFEAPDGAWLDLPGRGRTWLTDLAGPTPDAPAVILLHAVGCTGLLTWFPALARLAERYRVVMFDQRWHGRGIVSEHFSIRDCADDVAAVADALGLEAPVVAGYSMGSIVAQRCWRQHPERFGGLVLAATTDHFRTTGSERVFHQGMEIGMGALRTLSRSRTISGRRARLGVHRVPQHEPLGGRPGGGLSRSAPLDALALADRRADGGRGHHEGSRALARAPARDRGAHPGGDRP